MACRRSDLHGAVVVHDRYQSYDSFLGISHQLCCQHLLRDLEDAAESYTEEIWPGQTADALCGLIRAANVARDRGMSTVPGKATAEHLGLFRHGVRIGRA
jgi:transposase